MTVETTYAIVLTNSDHSDDVAMLFFNDEAMRDEYARVATDFFKKGYLGRDFNNDPESKIDYLTIRENVWPEYFPLKDCEYYSVWLAD